MSSKEAMQSKEKETRAAHAHPACLPGKSPQFAAAVVVNLVAFSFGCAAGWPSVAGPVLLELGYSDEALSWVAAVVWPAGLAGAALFGPLTEHWGRRRAALLVAVPFLAGWAATMSPSWGLGVILLGRVLQGVGMGGVLIACPVYVGEIVEDSLRGQLGSYMALFINAGILYVYAVGAQVSLLWVALLCGAVPLAFVLVFPWFPETPTFMLRRGDERGALASFAWLRDPRHADVDLELRALQASMDQQEGGGGGGHTHTTAGPRDLVSTRASRRATFIVVMLVVLQQFSGITAIINYAATIFELAGSSLQPSAAACIVAAVQLVGSVLSAGLVDSLGRLPILVVSFAGMATSMAILGACFMWPGALPAWVPVLCLSVYILVYAVGAGPGPFLLLVDVFPPRLRAIASQAVLSALCVLAFVVSKFFTQLSDALGPAGCFWLFGTCCGAGVAMILITVPETKGRAVDDIVAQLEGRGAPGVALSKQSEAGERSASV